MSRRSSTVGRWLARAAGLLASWLYTFATFALGRGYAEYLPGGARDWLESKAAPPSADPEPGNSR
jgi:hypothetical protein